MLRSIDVAVILLRLRDLDAALRLCANATRGVPPTISKRRDLAAVRRAIVGASSILRRRRARSHGHALAIPLPLAQLAPSNTGSDPAPNPEATAEEWSDWANYIHALRPGWISIRLQATACADAERADDRARELTKKHFDNRTATHAMMCGRTCTTSPSLRAVPLHVHYEVLFHGSVLTFLTGAALADQHGRMVACARDAHILLVPDGSVHAGVSRWAAATTRPLQAEPGKKQTRESRNFPRAPVLPQLAVFSPVKRPMWRVLKKTFSQIEAKEKSYGHLEKGTQIASAKSADMDQTALNHLILAISQW